LRAFGRKIEKFTLGRWLNNKRNYITNNDIDIIFGPTSCQRKEKRTTPNW